MPNSQNLPWKEPSDCPRCGCGWGIRITNKSIIVIYCSNHNCTYAWQSQAKTLYDAVKIWNKICENAGSKDRPNTPLLVEISKNGKSMTYHSKKPEKKS